MIHSGMSSGVSSIVPNQWRSFVERVLSVWSGYQLAIDFNSAGEETLQRHKVGDIYCLKILMSF